MRRQRQTWIHRVKTVVRITSEKQKRALSLQDWSRTLEWFVRHIMDLNEIGNKYCKTYRTNWYFQKQQMMCFICVLADVVYWEGVGPIWRYRSQSAFCDFTICCLFGVCTKRVLNIGARRRKWGIWRHMGAYGCVTEAYECIRMYRQK